MPNKVLIISPNWVGDLIMSQVLFKHLKQNDPAVTIDVLAPAWAVSLLDRMPEVNKVHQNPFSAGKIQLKKRWQIGKELRAENYQQAIVLPNSWKSAVIPFAAKIKKRTGWCGEWRYGILNDLRMLDKDRYSLMTQQFLGLGLTKNSVLPQQLLFPTLEVNVQKASRTLAKLQLSHEKPILAICPGAEYGSAKRWPAIYYAQIAREKIAQNWQVWIFGSQKDAKVAKEIQDATDNQCADLTGKTSLGEAVDLLSFSSAVITNDSGLMHVAAALQKPIVAIYGSSSPKFTPPLSERVKILSLNLSCSPCFKRECPLQHLNCLNDLKPELVLKELDELLKK